MQVSADDPDSGTNGQVEYRVDNSLFSINSDTGEVSTQLPLDYETQRSHDLLVQVSFYLSLCPEELQTPNS